jgi:glycosyltransferase involved in cell wall biosynthesis
MPAVTERAGRQPIHSGGWMTAGLDALVRRGGVSVTCAARAWPACPEFDLGGIRYVTLEAPEPVGRWRGVAGAWRAAGRQTPPVGELVALIDAVRPDVVHVHGSETPNAAAAVEAGRRMGVPVLLSVQGLAGECATTFFDGFDRAEIARDLLSTEFLKGRGLVQSWRQMRHAAELERFAFARAPEVAGRTEWDRDVVMHANPHARYWHVDEVLRPEFRRVTWDTGPDGPPAIVSVSSGAPYKGIDVLLHAFAAVRAKRHDARLRIIGPIAGTPVWPALRRLEERLGLGGNVEWTGALPAAAVADAMRHCSAYACASRIENSPNSVCEAMAVGAPVVAPATGGVPSLLRDGVDGLLFPTGDAAALAEGIGRLLTDTDLAVRLGRAAQERAQRRHDPDRVVTQLLTAYATLAGSPR